MNAFWTGFTKRAYEESSDPFLNTFYKPEPEKSEWLGGVKLDMGLDSSDVGRGQPLMFDPNESASDVYVGNAK